MQRYMPWSSISNQDGHLSQTSRVHSQQQHNVQAWVEETSTFSLTWKMQLMTILAAACFTALVSSLHAHMIALLRYPTLAATCNVKFWKSYMSILQPPSRKSGNQAM